MPHSDDDAPGGIGGLSGDDRRQFAGSEHFESKVGEVDAKIGPIEFHDEFSDPTVDISHERETADHEIVSGHTVYRERGTEFVVQALGRRPPEISITGWLTEEQLDEADKLVTADVVNVRTARYVGTAVPRSVDIPYSRVWHDTHNWIFEVDFELRGVAQR